MTNIKENLFNFSTATKNYSLGDKPLPPPPHLFFVDNPLKEKKKSYNVGSTIRTFLILKLMDGKKIDQVNKQKILMINRNIRYYSSNIYYPYYTTPPPPVILAIKPFVLLTTF